MNLRRIITSVAHKARFAAIKHSPELLMATGIAAATGGIVAACAATLKVSDTVAEYDSRIEKIKSDIIYSHRIDPTAVPYTQEQVTQDEMIAKGQLILGLVKLYLPAATLFIGGMICILSAHRVLKRRNVALMAAYKTLEEGFMQYRKRVVEDQGKDKDLEYRHGLKKKTITERVTDENGVEHEITKEIRTLDGKTPTMYARMFDRNSIRFVKGNMDKNLIYLKHQQAMFNDLLQLRGHIFLNEVYDVLGVSRTRAGQTVGWLANGNGDGYIDFGIYEIHNLEAVNCQRGGPECILLDFNVDGPILHGLKDSEYQNQEEYVYGYGVESILA